MGGIVVDPRGPTHTGSGNLVTQSSPAGLTNGNVVNQHVHQYWGVVPQQQRSVRVSAATKEIEALRAIFVAPEGFADLQHRLLAPGSSLVLTGASGSGRRAAAKMLLCPSAELASALRLLSQDDLIGSDRLSPDDISDEDRVLIDLSDVGESAFLQLQRDLLIYVASTERRRARLIILIPSRLESRLHDDLRGALGRVNRPDPWQILASSLRPHGLSVPIALIAPTDRQTLDQLPMSGVARVATFLLEAREQDVDGKITDWFGQAIAGVADHEDAVAELVSLHPSVDERTLLLSVAMAEQGLLEAVFWIERDLQVGLKYQAPTELHRLAEDGITDRVRGLRDELEIHNGRVRFRRFAFGQAVLTHFWDAYPDLRSAVADWVRRCVGRRELTAADREAIARRFAGQVARTNSLGLLYGVAQDWSTKAREESRVLAVVCLTEVLLDERTAYGVRSQIYHWSRSSNLATSFGVLLVGICTDVLAVGHLSQALIRLRWFCNHEAVVGAEARRALIQLCAENRTLEQFLAVLMDRERFDGALCRTIASPRRLADGSREPSPIVSARLARKAVVAWRQATDDLDTAEWKREITPWLDEHEAARGDGRYDVAAGLLRALTEICAGQVARLAQLYSANRTWLGCRQGSLDQPREAAAKVEEAVRRALADLPTAPSKN
ncbi:hypothetical protein [Kribbella sp. NPDC006257]|uniref:hypothetical protein n=1 Tax=Kribbella sp. NPDC006257 TaxID=3156738 RepID=UPI00339FB9CB